MPQSQTAAHPRHQEEEKRTKNIHAQNKQTNVREAQRPAPSSPSEMIRMLKQTEKWGQRAWEDFKTVKQQTQGVVFAFIKQFNFVKLISFFTIEFHNLYFMF